MLRIRADCSSEGPTATKREANSQLPVNESLDIVQFHLFSWLLPGKVEYGISISVLVQFGQGLIAWFC